MIRAVFDANTVASGLLRFRIGTSPPVQLLRAWTLGDFELLMSDLLIEEIIRTLSKPYFVAHVETDVVDTVLAALRHNATRVALDMTVAGVASHPEDDFVLAAAVSGNADFLVTGDKQLQRLGTFEHVKIISPRAFLTILQSESERIPASHPIPPED